MTTNDQNTDQQATSAPQDAQQTTDAPEATETPTTPEPAQLMAEAHKQREKLREARAENDDLQQRLSAAEERRDAVLRDSISRQLPDHISSDLFWELTPDMDGLLTEQGVPDDNAVQAAAQALAEQYNLTAPRPYIAAQGRSPEKYAPGRSVADAFRPRS